MLSPANMSKMSYPSELSCAIVAKICQDVGWHTAQKNALTFLAQLLENYIRKMSSTAVDFANHGGRTEPNVEDLAMAFKFIHIDLRQMQNYVLNVDSSPLPHKVPMFPLPCTQNRAIDNSASNDEERPECYEEWMPSLVHNKSSLLSALDQSSEQTNQVSTAVLDNIDNHSKNNESLIENESLKTPASETESQKNKLVLKFSLSKSVDDSTEENRTNAADSEANEANLSESALIALRLKRSRAFQNFLKSSLYRNPADPETKSTLRVADTQRLPNSYQSRENSPQPEPQSIHPNDDLTVASKPKKARRPKKKKSSVSNVGNLDFGFFNDDLSTNTKVQDFGLKKERKSSDSTEKKSKKTSFSLKMSGFGMADDNANMFDISEPGPFDLSAEEVFSNTKRQYKKKEKPPKVLSGKKRGRPKKIQSTSTEPIQLASKDGDQQLSSSKKKEKSAIESVFEDNLATEMLIAMPRSNETENLNGRKRKFYNYDSAGADSMTDPTPKKVGRPMKHPKAKGSTAKKFVKSAEIIDSGDSSDDDTYIDSNPVSLMPPLPEPTSSSDMTCFTDAIPSLSKHASSAIEPSSSHPNPGQAEKYSSKVFVSEHFDQISIAEERYHKSANIKESTHKTKKHSKDKGKVQEEKLHKKHKRDKEKLKKSKEFKEKRKERDKEKTVKAKLSFRLSHDLDTQRTLTDFDDAIEENSNYTQSTSVSSLLSIEHKFPENFAIEAPKKKRGRKKKVLPEEEGNDLVIKDKTSKLAVQMSTSILDNPSTSFDIEALPRKRQLRESKAEKELHPKRESNADGKKESKSKKVKGGLLNLVFNPSTEAEKLNKKDKRSETKSSNDFTIITETIEDDSDDTTNDQWHCPVCNFPDVGAPMIGCDRCLEWFHYGCAGISITPAEDQKWFCTTCKRKEKKEKAALMKEKKSIDNTTSANTVSMPSVNCSSLSAQTGSSSTSTPVAKPGYIPTGRPRGRPRKYPAKPQVTITESPLPVFLPQQPLLPRFVASGTHHSQPTQPSSNRFSYLSADLVNAGPSTSGDQQECLPSKPTSSKKRNRKEICPTCNVAINCDYSISIRCDICSQWFHWKCVGIYSPPSPDANWYCGPCKCQPSTSGIAQLVHETIYEDEDEDSENLSSKQRCGICFLATSTSDDVSEWVACDECDQWYHFECQGITEPPPDEESWFCPKCIARQKSIANKLLYSPNVNSSLNATLESC